MIRFGLLSLLLFAACATTSQETREGKPTTKSKAKKKKKAAKKGTGADAEAVKYSDTRPVPKPTAAEVKDFERIWELYRKRDKRWPLERDRFLRRSDAAAYLLAGHLLRYYMRVNASRMEAPKDLIRVKKEIVAVGKPCVPALVDMMVLKQLPMPDGRHWLTDDFTRQDCREMLEEMGSVAVPRLLRTLKRKGTDVKGRRLIALALGGTKDARAYDPLVRLLRSDPSWQVRADAATALAKLGDVRAIKPLAEAVRTDTDPAVVKRAGKARHDLLQRRS